MENELSTTTQKQDSATTSSKQDTSVKPEEKNGEQVLKDDITEQFAGIPMGLLICQPILEVAKGQMALCQVYIDTLLTLAYQDPSDPTKGCRTIPFTFERLIIDKETGKESVKTMTLNAPLISLVPLPAFTMDEVTVDFDMEVTETNVDTSSDSSSITNTDSFNFWGCSASVTGTVSANSSHTRTTDNSAKYKIHARAVQQPPSEGMAKLTSLFAESMQPIEKQQ